MLPIMFAKNDGEMKAINRLIVMVRLVMLWSNAFPSTIRGSYTIGCQTYKS
jgi:hypothetical protein